MLLTLHYVYPLPLQKWHHLIATVGHIENLSRLSASVWAQIFNIRLQRAITLRDDYLRIVQLPLEDYYEQLGIVAIPFFDVRYPAALLQLDDAPTVLYAKGDTALLQAKPIAIIGSRKATTYSQQVLRYIVPPLIEQHFTIVSGLAAGADRFAHEAAMYYGGRTIGVLGHGFNYCYPSSNRMLLQQMFEEQLVITEYPPHVKPAKWQFPMRNRIISGMSLALVVTEAAKRSGTLITTDQALGQGKDVFVVPGPIDSEQSKGTNQLIKDGAIVVWDGYQIINELRINSS